MTAASVGQQGHFQFMAPSVVWWGKHNYEIPWERAVLMWPGILLVVSICITSLLLIEINEKEE